MTKFYQVVNFQHDPVRTFKSQVEAQNYADKLRKQYDPPEGFYVIELNVVYSVGDIQ